MKSVLICKLSYPTTATSLIRLLSNDVPSLFETIRHDRYDGFLKYIFGERLTVEEEFYYLIWRELIFFRLCGT